MNNYHQTARQVVLAILLGLSFAPAHTNATFQDRTTQMGLSLTEGAAAWGDYDNDGWVDLYAAGTLWRNNKGKTFTKVMSNGSGLWGDYDNDGHLDLFVWNNRQLLRNNQDGTFIPISLPKFPKSRIRAANWADYDGDGYVDLYVGGWETGSSSPYPDVILRNDGGAGFVLQWQSDPNRCACGITSCDFDNDGDMDVYVSNYRLQPNVLLLNDGNGNVKDVAADYNALATSAGFCGGHSIGAAWGDFDNDGDFDLFAGNFAHPPNSLPGGGPPTRQPESRFLKNLGPEKNYTFQDLGQCGIYYQETYGSPAAGDYDNDGDLDLFFTTIYDSTQTFGRVPNYSVLFRNDGDWTFKDVTSAEGLGGLMIKDNYQAAWADFDNDGDLDLVTAGKLFENQGNKNNWLKVQLKGDGKKVNCSAIGAQVRIRIRDKTVTRQVEAGTGEGNQNDMTLHFGLGKWDRPVPTVEIAWPNGVVQKIHKVRPNTLLDVGFWERRAMEALPITVLILIVAGIAAACGYNRREDKAT